MAETWLRLSYTTEEKKMLVWLVPGEVTVADEQGPTFHMDAAYTAVAVHLHVKAAPTGADLIIDIEEGGVTLFSTLPKIAASAETGGGSAVMDNTSIANNAEVRFNIDQIGSGDPGEDLTVTLEMTLA